ncbi:MAG: HD domain-containing phosphohydrolase [Chloroflexota bacterium]
MTDRTEGRDKVQETGKATSEVKEYQARLEILYEVAQQANSIAEVSKLLEEILLVTQRVVHASASSLLIINEEKGEFYLQAAGGEKSNLIKQTRLELDSGIVGWVARKGTPVMVNDAYKDKRFNKHVDEATGFVTRSVMAAPIVRGQNIIGVLEIINKEGDSVFNERDLLVLSGFAKTEALILLVSMSATAINNIKLCQAIQAEYKSTVETLANAADTKDPYASGHSRRVKEYALLAANFFGFSSEAMQAIEFGALLHDIGKIGIADTILRKAGPLTTGEWYIMRKHALRGANIVSEIPCLDKARDIILHHPERYDGTGYPGGLKGEEIPIGARLVAVADAFDTMTTDHSYRAALSVDEAMSELVNGIGAQFCPRATEAFITGFQKSRGKPAMREAVREAIDKAKMAVEAAREEEGCQEPASQEGEPVAEEAIEAEAVVAEVTEKPENSEAAERAIAPELYRGDVELAIKSPVDFRQINQFKRCLRTVADLKIILDGWSEAEGSIVVVSLQKPLALAGLLREMPIVEQVYPNNKDFIITLKQLP